MHLIPQSPLLMRMPDSPDACGQTANSENKKLRIKKYPDGCGWGLSIAFAANVRLKLDREVSVSGQVILCKVLQAKRSEVK